MMRMGSASQLGDIRRYGKGIRASTKSVLYSDYYEDDKKDQPNFTGQRSISLSALHGSAPLEPRMARLETLEAKMASIEVSLSTTPRRKKSSSVASTPTPPTPVNNQPSTNIINNNNYNNSNNNNQSRSSKEIAKELERLRNTLRDKENVIHSLKGQLCTTGSRVGYVGRNVSSNGPLGEKEKKVAQERLSRLKTELDTKRLAIKNIKLALDSIDVTDNIDIRIQQAELEYQLGREELNLLSLLEESRNLQSFLEETNIQQQTIFGYVGHSTVSLHCVELTYDPKSPQFGAGQRDEGGLYVEWAVDDSGLCKGDRLLEVNGKLVLGRSKEEMYRLLSVSPSPAQLVVMKKQSLEPEKIMSDLKAELSVVREKAGEAERLRDCFRSDNVRLSHRISYLEEQVAELLERARGPPPTGLQVFQKGPQVALVANLPEKNLLHSTPKPKLTQDEARSTKSVDVLIEKPKRKRDLHPARSTNSLDVESQMTSSRTRQHSHSIERDRHKTVYRSDSDHLESKAGRRYSEHLHGEQRQRHIRDARSSLSDFMDKRSLQLDFDSEPSGYNKRLDSSSQRSVDYSSETSLQLFKKQDGTRPIPPKKPFRLSLHKAKSLQSVDGGEKKILKRTHKGEAPPIPQQQIQSTSLHNGHIVHNSLTEKWC